jgi:hypothetical protein
MVEPLISKPRNHGRLRGYSQLSYYGNCHWAWMKRHSGNKCGVAAAFTAWLYRTGTPIDEATFIKYDDWLSWVNGRGSNFGLLGTDGEGVRSVFHELSGNTVGLVSVESNDGSAGGSFQQVLSNLDQGILCVICLDWHTPVPGGHWAVAYAYDEHRIYLANDVEQSSANSHTWETEGRSHDSVRGFMSGGIVTLAGMDGAIFIVPKR